jgi:hypothetical protein
MMTTQERQKKEQAAASFVRKVWNTMKTNSAQLLTVGVILFFAIFFTVLYAIVPDKLVLAGTEVTNVFVDVNGDGAVDLLVSGEVVFNTTPLAPTPSLPLP